jgi:hypothetical protein
MPSITAQKPSLPVLISPLPDELLSCWLVRLARANSARLQALSMDLVSDQRLDEYRHQPSVFWQRDVDRSIKRSELERMSQRVEIPGALLLQHTLRGLEQRLYKPSPDDSSLIHWVLNIGVRSLSRNWFGLQFCPHCLREDPIPYFRRSWRMAFLTICPKHWTPLLDRCPKCGSPAHFAGAEFRKPRSKINRNPITLCYQCEFDLRLAEAGWGDEVHKPVRNRAQGHRRGFGESHRTRNSIASTRLYYFQAWLIEGLERGWFDLADLSAYTLKSTLTNPLWLKHKQYQDAKRMRGLSKPREQAQQPVSSLEFFDGLRIVARLMASDCGPSKGGPRTERTWNFKPRDATIERLCFLVRKAVGMRKVASGEARDAVPIFERMRVEERRLIMMMTAYLMLDWPKRFVELCQKVNVTASRVGSYDAKEPPPDWYLAGFMEALSKGAKYPNLTNQWRA